ncbi:MAG: ATP-binding cassette domain-containing protein [Hungatella sp.]|jgi:ABC-type lipoprotein export system ATPase subunit|nr:ATP-binding cassette domain-containing protein [Hungatella sp.]
MAIDLKHVSYMIQEGKSNRKILDDISYSFSDNQMVTINGPSGSGKTTLLYALGGLLNITDGDVQINNRSLIEMQAGERDDFRLNNISYIYQNLNLFSFMNVEDNILISYYLRNEKINKEVQDHIGEYLHLFGLGKIQKKDISVLSGGEKQRIAIIRALISNPKIILCDEPTANLDSENTIKFMDYLTQAKKITKSIIIIVTHDDRVYNYGDTKLKMLDGKIII